MYFPLDLIDAENTKRLCIYYSLCSEILIDVVQVSTIALVPPYSQSRREHTVSLSDPPYHVYTDEEDENYEPPELYNRDDTYTELSERRYVSSFSEKPNVNKLSKCWKQNWTLQTRILIPQRAIEVRSAQLSGYGGMTLSYLQTSSVKTIA
ncbi:hypothetical protein J6590_104880 [Homalodisca vitripennis]|nr:hypothetical protein J6590_104880 [Homalodisca vitripennis]